MAQRGRPGGGGRIPDAFARALAGRPAAPGGPDGDSWLRRLPGLVDTAARRWELTIDDALARFGECALVLPVTRRDGTPAALKLTWPHRESRHEHLALRAWSGDGAVRLLAAYPSEDALLLERLDPDSDLTGVDEYDACQIIGGLLARLDRPALPQLDTLSAWVEGFTGRAALGNPHLPRRFVEQARTLAVELASDAEAVDARLVHTDLHYENVLAHPVSRESLAIDPKPMAAEPAFAVWPALHNRWAEAADGSEGELRWSIRCRLGWLCHAAGIDEDRSRAWALVRTVDDAIDLAAAGDAETVSQRIRLLKALQPDA